jgi:tetratricopeptide (TPR) repeat protein
MISSTDALKKKFREGRHAEAIAEGEALHRKHPADRELTALCAKMHVLSRSYARALELLRELRDPAHEDAELLFNIGNCEKELQQFDQAAATFTTYTEKFSNDAGGWANLADCRFHLNDMEEGVRVARRALALDPSFAPELAKPRVAQGDALHGTGQVGEAGDQYIAALAMVPGDAATLRKATMCLLEVGRGDEGIALCREALRIDPGNLTAKLGAEWLLTQMVPLWHIPMMNEQERNQAFHDGIAAADVAGKTVFEIGTGSGLLAMMAAKLGATKVFTCEAVPLIAETATRIVERNGYQDRVTVLSKPSNEVQVGKDLPAKADVLVHEVFSSELLGEHVLPAIEDAKARLLKPGGKILPYAASIMVALVGGEELAKNLHVDASFGFDLSDFNAIHPRKRPLYREDLAPVLLSEPVEAFRFDFMKQSTFPAERKRFEVVATQAGVCHGLIQWIRIELAPGVVYENHPSHRRAVSNWQHTVYGFEGLLSVQEGSALAIRASHDRIRPWFDLAKEPVSA